MEHVTIELNSDSDEPYYQQLTQALRDAIMRGMFTSSKFPSIRDLAEHLGVSKKTVNRSYELLQLEGLIDMTRGKHAVVVERTDSRAKKVDPMPIRVETTSFHKRLSNTEAVGIIAAFNSNAPHVDDLPLTKWERCRAAHLKASSPAFTEPRDPFGMFALRRAISLYVRRIHGVICEEDDIAVLPESRHGISMIAWLHIRLGDRVVMEEPGSRWARRILQAHGADIISIPIDEEGMLVEALQQVRDPVRLVYVTPSHHDPVGTVMSLPRRKALMEWANAREVIVIEDNSDSFYRYSSGLIPALQTFDTQQQVIYISSFWKVLYPLIPFGFAIFPKSISNEMKSTIALANHDSVPRIDQCVLADFISEGHFDRHVREITGIYNERRNAVLEQMSACFGDKVYLAKEGAGFVQYLRLNLPLADDQILECAEDVNLKLIPVAPFYANEPSRGEFLIPFGSIVAADLHSRIKQFAKDVNTTMQL